MVTLYTAKLMTELTELNTALPADDLFGSELLAQMSKADFENIKKSFDKCKTTHAQVSLDVNSP